MTPYLDVQHLTKSFGALTLFRDISFSIGEGQKVGLIAKNGTTARASRRCLVSFAVRKVTTRAISCFVGT